MVKQIIKDVTGELLETGKATGRAGKKAVTDVGKQMGKTITNQQDSNGSELEWLEKGAQVAGQAQKPKSVTDPDTKVKQQIERMKAQDKKQATQAYDQIQKEIENFRKQKAAQPRKYVTGATRYDKQQHQDPETFWDKVKKKKEALAQKLPWTSKKGMGTGEIRRGTSG